MVFSIVIAMLIFARECLDYKSLLSQLLLMNAYRGALKGLGALWFVPMIMYCYMLTPFLQRYRDVVKTLDSKHFGYSVISIVLLLLYFGDGVHLLGQNSANWLCYILGYYFGCRYVQPKLVFKSRMLE